MNSTKRQEPFNGEEMLSREEFERLLSITLFRGADFAEIYLERLKNHVLTIGYEGSIRANLHLSCGIGIRATKGDRIGYAYSNDLSPLRLEAIAKTAAYIADTGVTSRAVKLCQRVPPSFCQISLVPSHIPVQQKSELLHRAYTKACHYDSRIKKVHAHYEDTEKQIIIANSEGHFISDQQHFYTLYMDAIAEAQEKSGQGLAGKGIRNGAALFEPSTVDQIATDTARHALLQLESVEAPAGMLPVVLGPGSAGVLFHEAIGHSLEADYVRNGNSIYKGRIGQKVASGLCTLVDDATLPNHRGSLNVDDEGTPGQRKVLIERGVLCGYLYDKHNAKLMNAQSTGNGRRASFQNYPIPRMTNTFLESGDSEPEEIIQSVHHGVYVKKIGDGHMSPSSGRFTFTITEGYLIENGKITSPLQWASLIGNASDLLFKVVMVGCDLQLEKGYANCGKESQQVPIGAGAPTLKVSELTIGGTHIR